MRNDRARWFQRVAEDDPWLLQVLAECPDPMCPDINAAQATHYRLRAGERQDYPDDENGVDACYSVAERLDERAEALNTMLEDCRSGLDRLRDAVIALAERYTADQQELARLGALVSEATANERAAIVEYGRNMVPQVHSAYPGTDLPWQTLTSFIDAVQAERHLEPR